MSKLGFLVSGSCSVVTFRPCNSMQFDGPSVNGHLPPLKIKQSQWPQLKYKLRLMYAYGSTILVQQNILVKQWSNNYLDGQKIVVNHLAAHFAMFVPSVCFWIHQWYCRNNVSNSWTVFQTAINFSNQKFIHVLHGGPYRIELHQPPKK